MKKPIMILFFMVLFAVASNSMAGTIVFSASTTAMKLGTSDASLLAEGIAGEIIYSGTLIGLANAGGSSESGLLASSITNSLTDSSDALISQIDGSLSIAPNGGSVPEGGTTAILLGLALAGIGTLKCFVRKP